MESKVLLLVLLIVGCFNMSFGQDKNDPIHFSTYANVGYQHFSLKGQMNTGTSSQPFYEMQKNTSQVLNAAGMFGIHIPVYQNEKISLGAETYIGFGFTESIKNAEGLQQIYFPICAAVYVRKYYGNDDENVKFYGVQVACLKNNLIGFSVPPTALNIEIHLPTVHPEKYMARFKLYCSLFQEKVYTYFSNGKTETALKGFEVGLGFIYN